MEELIETRKMQMFVAIIKEGNMRKASEQLCVTPSAVSHGIRSLEEDLDTQLFLRNGANLTPTDAGMLFYNEAQDILGRLGLMLGRFSNGGPKAQKQLHIGTTNTGCKYLFPAIVREFRESFPDVALKLEIGDTAGLSAKLNQRKIDFIIAPTQRDYRDLVQMDLGSDELVYIVNPSHPWVRSGGVEVEELIDQRLIVPAVLSHTYMVIDDFYREKRIPFEPFIEVNNEEAIKQLVTLNIGIGIVPRWIARDEIEKGTLKAFPLCSEPLMRRWTLSHRPSPKFDFPEFLFMSMTKSVAENLLERSEEF